MTRFKFSLFPAVSCIGLITAFYLFTSHYKPFIGITTKTDECYCRQNNEFVVVASKWNRTFEGFNNVVGADRFIVPNIIHFIRLNLTEYSFIDYVVIKAAMRNHRPDNFYIHTDVPGPGQFTGRYWNLIQNDHELWSRIQLLHLEAPSEIFGQNLNPGVHNLISFQ